MGGMLYQLHELTRNLLAPWVHQAQANAKMFSDPDSLWASLPGAERMAASNELFHRLGKNTKSPPGRSTMSRWMATRCPSSNARC